MTQRAKNLDDSDIASIVSLLDGWSDKLSWDLLIKAIESRLGQRYTRQALSKHARILQAFQLRKTAIAESRDVPVSVASSPELQVSLERIARLEAENMRLEAERVALLEQFARWAYNAHVRGLGPDILDQPLPVVDRDRTDRPPKATTSIRR